jgi:hypothetical protein
VEKVPFRGFRGGTDEKCRNVELRNVGIEKLRNVGIKKRLTPKY